MPAAVVIVGLVWFLVFQASRYVSVASIAAAVALPVTIATFWHFGLGGNAPLLSFAILISVLAIWRHRSNIQRLMNGTESRFHRKTAS
jgi:glycerol-3-phosphate acyltransferase PlsY